MLVGMCRFTGEEISGVERAVQSIETTFTTPFKTQPGKRDFGSPAPDLISMPLTEDTIMDVFGAIVDAVEWEPEAELKDFGLSDAVENGRVDIFYSIRFIPSDEVVRRIIGKGVLADAQGA